jgi:predicted lipoprotein with Yx(FWY)xxD motif
MKTFLTIAVLAIGVSVAAAGCGSGGDSTSGSYGGSGESASSGSRSYGSANGSTTTSSSTAASGEGGAATVSVASAPELGRILVDSKGFTLYDFHKDKGTTSACYGPCAKAWPPLITEGVPQPSNGASSSMLGTTMRKDGTTQVTYAGHPLYTFVEDTKPGDAKGNDFSAFGAQWYALKASGQEPGD